jgi:hypothetical protein
MNRRARRHRMALSGMHSQVAGYGQEGATYQSAMFQVAASKSGHGLKLHSVGRTSATSATMYAGT